MINYLYVKLTFYLLLLIIYFTILGDSFLLYQFSSKKSELLKRNVYPNMKINNYTILEHFSFSYIFGASASIFITIPIIYLTKFSWPEFLIIGTSVIIINFYINRDIIRELLLFRILDRINNLNNKKIKDILYFLFSIFSIFYIYYVIRLYWFPQNHDMYLYLHHTLDAIEYGWNKYDPNYLGKIFVPKLYLFFLIPYTAIDPFHWDKILWDILPILNQLLFFLLIYSISKRTVNKINWIAPFLYLGGGFFVMWFFSFLPSNWVLYLLIILANHLLINRKPNFFITLSILICIYVFHSPSFIYFFSIPILSIFTYRLIIEPNSYPKLQKMIKKVLNLNIKLLIVIISAIIIILFLFIRSALFQLILQDYKSYILPANTNPIAKENIGWYSQKIAFILFVLYYIGLLVNIKRKFPREFWKSNNIQILESNLENNEDTTEKNTRNQLNSDLFGIQNVYSLFFIGTFVILNLFFWFFDNIQYVIRTLYLYYRFQILLKFSLIISSIILVDFFSVKIVLFSLKFHEKIKNRNRFQLIKNNILKKKRNDYSSKNRKNIEKLDIIKINYTKKKKKFVYSIILISLISINIPSIYSNRENVFGFYYLSRYTPRAYIGAFHSNNITFTGNTTYLFNQKSKVVNWNIVHSYLYKYNAIDLDFGERYLYDKHYRSLDLNSSSYQNFLNFYFKINKPYYSYQAKYKYLQEKYTNQSITYLFLDNITNPNLIRLIEKDNIHFFKVYEKVDMWVGQYYYVVVFTPKYNSHEV